MKICITPDCENYCEGNTDYCGSCNHSHRKEIRIANKPEKKRKPLKARSEKRKLEEQSYNKLVAIWKKGKKCGVRGCSKECDDAHHQLGREGDLLLNSKYWFPICREHHIYITTNSAWALSMGYSLPRNQKIES
jgi:hypothetical protein